jgi:hypothetical protein
MLTSHAGEFRWCFFRREIDKILSLGAHSYFIEPAYVSDVGCCENARIPTLLLFSNHIIVWVTIVLAVYSVNNLLNESIESCSEMCGQPKFAI